MNKPEHNYANNDNNYKYTIKLPWIPIIGGSKLRREFKKEGIRTIFKSSANLKSILCQRLRQVLILEYISYSVLVKQNILVKQKKKILSRPIEHQHNNLKGK